MQFAMLHDALPEPRLLGQDQMVAIKIRESRLIAADAAGIGGRIDVGDQRLAVVFVIAAIGVVFANQAAGWRNCPRVQFLLRQL